MLFNVTSDCLALGVNFIGRSDDNDKLTSTRIITQQNAGEKSAGIRLASPILCLPERLRHLSFLCGDQILKLTAL